MRSRRSEDLGGDVIVKPLFGAMGLGMARVEDPDIAHRAFRALELERAVYYLQETIPHAGEDVRALVVGDAVVAAIRRTAPGWRVNLAGGATAHPVRLEAEREESSASAPRPRSGAEVAGVDGSARAMVGST
ncbi:MAG: hypothetical protein R2736_23265 [Solirubrobacterales bacterium]